MRVDKYGLPIECVECNMRNLLNNITLTGEEKEIYQRKQLERFNSLREDISSDEFYATMMELYNPVAIIQDFSPLKSHFNQLVLSLAGRIEGEIESSTEPLFTALKYAFAANYIDYSSVDVTDEGLYKILVEAKDKELDYGVYCSLLEEIKSAKNLLYIIDNCGEIVIDKLVIKQILKINPSLRVTALVKHGGLTNDATMEDAVEVGLVDVCGVVDNGSDFPGTKFNKMASDKVELVKNSELIISKGQANCEDLMGLGLNAYYLFLCKCAYFKNLLNIELYSGVLIKESN